MIKQEEFERIVKFVKSRTGIDLGDKRVLVTGRLDNYLARRGIESYSEYLKMVEQDITGKEAIFLIDSLTTNHTYFMREFEHFEFLKNEILPDLKKREQDSKDLRIWSAACSTGEEPYMLAMVLCDFFGLEHNLWDTTVLATDLSTKVIEYAKKGRYLGEHMEPVPPAWRQRYFKRVNEIEWEVKPALKKEVVFNQFNLMNAFTFKKKFHVVFLRNVMIYFDEATKREMVERIYQYLEPGGYLIIGATEFIDRNASKFQYVRPSIFRKI